jgi:hypothetical protein
MGYVSKMGSELEFYIFEDSFAAARGKDYKALVPPGWYNEDYHIFQTTKEEPLIRAMRASGFAAWLRDYGEVYPESPVHIHAIAIGDAELSPAAVEQLTGPNGYFRGSETFREQIRHGNVALPLEQLKRSTQRAGGCAPFEQTMLKDIEIAQKYMQRVAGKSHDPRLSSPAFHAQAQLLLAGLLSRAPAFIESVRKLHDRCGQA